MIGRLPACLVVRLLGNAVALFLVALLLGSPATAAPDFDAIDAQVEAQRKAMHLPGLALGIVHGDQVVHVRGFGIADPTGRAVTPQTPFILGSVSKSFTALAIMQLVEAGRIDLDAPVRRYLPWFRVADEQESATITVSHLLHHTSGLPTSAGFQPIFNVDYSDGALEKGVRALRGVALDRPVGTHYEYCNANYTTLGLIVQTVAGIPYGRYVQEHIFVPLDMRRSFVDLESALRNEAATGYRQAFTSPFPSPRFPYPPGFLPAGFLFASAEDMCHYLIAQINGGRYASSRVLSPKGVVRLHAPAVRMIPGRELYYGMGWVNRVPNDIPVWWHDGDTGHFHTEMSITREGGWGVILLTNASHFLVGQSLNELPVTVMSLLVGKEPRDNRRITAVISAIYVALLAIPTAQLLAMLWSWRTARRWRRDPTRRPRGARDFVRRVVLAPLVNVLATIGLLVLMPQLFGGAAPLSEIMYSMPDFGVAVIVSIVASVGWLARTAYVVARGGGAVEEVAG